ncbi:MAG TPA: carbohydrate kinase [Acidimicrobiales bacterium]|nr:carbohydrate kinase [Acidimicrobiales bacterium]
MTSPRVVSCGEALIDLICADATGRTWRAAPGGSPYNAAVAAGRLGAPTTFLGVLSDDRFGQVLRDHLDVSHVSWRTCPITAEPTTLAVVTQGPDDAEPAFAFHVLGTTTVSPRVNDLHLPADVGVFHTSGSMALVLEPAASRLEALLAAARHRGLVHLDPNPRPTMAGGRERYLRRLERWLGLVDVVKISAADVDWLHPGLDPLELAHHWLTPAEEGDDVPAAVVVTRGAKGAAVVCSAGVVEVEPAEQVHVVDTVGAGDTFVGAMLAAFAAHGVTGRARLAELDAAWWRTALTYAVEAAGIACTRVGADPPWRHELR